MFEPRSIREERQQAAKAEEIRLMCPHCYGCVYVTFSQPLTLESRQREIKVAIEEHRPLCTGAPPEAGRVWTIDYPRA